MIPIKFGNKEVGKNYKYVSFRFRQDGSTSLPPNTSFSQSQGQQENKQASDSWYVTLINNSDLHRDINSINFYTLQIDARSGVTKPYRPGGT